MDGLPLFDAEHARAQALQRDLLPQMLPLLPAVARYLPAGPDTTVGGDWHERRLLLHHLPIRRLRPSHGQLFGRPGPVTRRTASFALTATGCATSDSLGFDQFSNQAKAVGAGSFVTMNYGSGTPSEAAAWVTHSLTAPEDGVAFWEVGNETYDCWEVDNWLARPPEDYQGYTPNATCRARRFPTTTSGTTSCWAGTAETLAPSTRTTTRSRSAAPPAEATRPTSRSCSR